MSAQAFTNIALRVTLLLFTLLFSAIFAISQQSNFESEIFKNNFPNFQNQDHDFNKFIKTTNQNTQIDLTHLTAGIYILKIQNGNKVENRKVVKIE